MCYSKGLIKNLLRFYCSKKLFITDFTIKPFFMYEIFLLKLEPILRAKSVLIQNVIFFYYLT